MGNNISKKENSKDTSARILNAATILFAENNFDAVSIKKISDTAKANSALISYYFGSKQKLYQEVLDVQADIMLSILYKTEKKSMSALKKLCFFMDEQIKMHLVQPHTVKIIYREMISPSKAGEDIIKSKIFALADFIQELMDSAIQQGSIKKGIKTRASAFTLLSIVSTFLLTHEYVLTTGRINDGNDYDYIRNIYIDYIDSLLTGKETLE